MDVRARLIAAAARVFSETGYRGATTRRIAQEAGVNEVTLFRHFGSKWELIREAVLAYGRRELVPPLPEEPRDPERELTAWAAAHLEHLYRARAFIRTCMGEMEEHGDLTGFAAEHPRQVTAVLKRYLTRLKEVGLADPELDPAVAAAMLRGALFSDAMGRDVMPDMFE
ncbi:MAG: helix-turn-helix transcriptional regulator, partial [Gemmatimonadetes bacterium]|nr:helix-turn-helix transcriptional regulator [Gemmatimonadota bacterium]